MSTTTQQNHVIVRRIIWESAMISDVINVKADEDELKFQRGILAQCVVLDPLKYGVMDRVHMLNKIMRWLRERAEVASRFPLQFNDIEYLRIVHGSNPNRWAMRHSITNRGWNFWIENDNLRTEFILTWK